MENVNPDVVVIVLGVLAAVAIAVITYLRASNNNNAKWLVIAEVFAPILPALVGRADVALAAYGQQLKPINDMAQALGTLIDEETDWAMVNLPRPLAMALQEALGLVDDLTDGEIEPVQEVNIGEATK